MFLGAGERRTKETELNPEHRLGIPKCESEGSVEACGNGAFSERDAASNSRTVFETGKIRLRLRYESYGPCIQVLYFGGSIYLWIRLGLRVVAEGIAGHVDTALTCM